MVNKEHLKILKQGVETWNQWRHDHPDVKPDLSYARLDGADLHGMNLFGVDLRSAEDVRAAVQNILEKVEAAEEDIIVDGFLVQQMITGGKETILGVSTDPVFGPMVMFGAGGIYVEVLKDVSFRLAPITDRDADEMMQSIRAWPLLTGVRGEQAVDLDSVKDALLRVSKLVSDFRRIVEFDVNPFIAHEERGRCCAVDVRLRIEHPE